MEELELIVQRMMDAGESEESIAQVIKTYDPKKAIDPVKEAANAGSVEKAAGSIEDTVSKLENGFSDFRKEDPKDIPEYPSQEKDIISAPTTVDSYLKDLEASKAFYKTEAGKDYAKRKVNYREAVKAKLYSNGAYKLGVEGRSYDELIQNGLFSAMSDPVNELHFELHGNVRPDQEIRDQIIQEEVYKAQEKENQSLRDLETQEQEKYIANGDYKPMLETFEKQATSTFTPEEKNLSNLNKDLTTVNTQIKKTVDIEEKRVLINKRTDLISQIESSPVTEGRTFLFDPITSEPIGTFEASEKPDEIIDRTQDYQNIKQEYSKSGKEKLERKAFTHGLEKSRLNKVLNTTLAEYGLTGNFSDLTYKELLARRKDPVFIPIVQKSIDKQKVNSEYISEPLQDKLNSLAEDSIRLNLEEAALKETYYLNLDPSSDDADYADATASFLKESAKSIGKIVGLDKEVAELIPSTRMEELDEINKLFTSNDIPISEENKEAFNRGFGMQFAEGMGGFVGDLAQFALLNKVAGAAGITARIAQITSKSKVRGTALKLLQEEFNFQVVTKGEAPTGEGIFFGLGSMGATKLIPKIKNSKFARFNSLIEKTVAPGVGMAAGSEAAAFAHAVVDDFANNKDIKTALKEQYGDLDETGMRIVLNMVMGSSLAVRSLKTKDFTSIVSRRELLKNTEKETLSLDPSSIEAKKKLALIDELKRDISFADEAFNKQDIGAQKEERDRALKIIESEANPSAKKEAQVIVDLYEVNKILAEKKIRKSFENLKRAGIKGDIKLVITDDPALLETGNKGQFDTSNNTIIININKYKPGIFEQETGHFFMKAAFNNNVEVAKAFKNKISEVLNEKLKGETFNLGSLKGLSFEEVIKEAYKKQKADVPEEYIMNAVEFLSNPKYKDLLTKKGLLNGLKQETLNVANKIGFDYTNKKNFKNGADLLEFLFSINKTIEGGSAKAIKKKFEAFENLVIDGKKLLDLKTGKEAVDKGEGENIMASIEMESSNKKDIFSKAEKVYEEYKEDISSAGLMVGLEFEPIVKKMLNKYKDVYGMDAYTLDLIANDVMIETRPGYNGIPALVKTWDATKGASLTSHIYGNLPKRILGIIQNKYPDLGRTVSLVAEKAEKLTTDEGFGGGGGFVDTSSPELYTRVARKKAEVTMGMSPEYAKRAEEVGERILMSTPLKDLDAKIVGTIKTNDGKTLRVAMLESNKARVYSPDGTVEVISARTPKVIEQKYGAPEKSFKKIPTTKSLMIEDAKAYLIPEMEKEAGGLVDNYEPTVKYREFVDKTFSLYKDYLSQSAINKRFADFKEPVIDAATGKQAREKTAQGNKIFTKKTLALAEWRKYFIGDGTRRIDGRRRSLLEALATEQGFDKVVEVLTKESVREQIKSRQQDLNVDLIDNYVALISKSLDRGNPDIMASLDILESKTKDKIAFDIQRKLILAEGDYFKVFDLLEEDNKEIIKEYLSDLYLNDIKEAVLKESEIGSKTTIEHLIKVSPENSDTWSGVETIQSMTKESLKAAEGFIEKTLNNTPLEWANLSSAGAKTTSIKFNLLSRLNGYNGTRSKKIFLKDPVTGKIKQREIKRYGGTIEYVDSGEIFNRDRFEKTFKNSVGKNFESFKNSKIEKERTLYKKVRTFNNKIEGLASLDIHYKEFTDLVDKARALEGATAETIKETILNKENEPLIKKYLKEQKIRKEFFDLQLDILDITTDKLRSSLEKGEISETQFNDFIAKGVGSFFVNNDFRGFRDFSKKVLFDISPYKDERRDQHLNAKAIIAGDFIKAFKENTLSQNREIILDNYESLLGSKGLQKIADKGISYTYTGNRFVKVGAEQLKLTKGGAVYKRPAGKSFEDINLEYLNNQFNIETGKTLKQEFVAEKIKEISEYKVNPELKTDKGVNQHNADILNKEVLASKDITPSNEKSAMLSNALAEMIERKTGISSKAPISAALASNIGKRKGKFDFYLPPNAEDFAGLMYKVYGKGKQGDADMDFIKKHLLDPYNAGEQAISTYKQNLAQDYKSIEKQLGEVEGTVTKETKAELEKLGFNADQAVRVALWNAAGFEIPGIKNIEAAKLRRVVLKDKRLKAYADGVKAIVKGNLFEPSEQWFSSNIRYDLFTHATEGVRPIFLEQWTENAKAIFTPENMNRLKAAYGADYVNNLQSMMERMKSGKSRGANVGKEVNAALDYLNGSVGVIMWMNTRSAMLQTISAVNYINWGDNNPINIAKTLAKPKEFAATFKEIMNSDFLKQRRSGLEINIEEAEIAKAVEKSKGQASKIFNALIKAGFKPTQIADSFAIAIGGTPLLMNRTKTYQRKGFSLAEAKEKAFNDLREISEENQQSSRQDRVSNIQTGLLGRLVFAFNNTPMQMSRLQKKSALDLINRRGDWKTNVSKLAYYSTIQSVIFYALQQGAALTLFGKDDEDLSESEKENLEKFKEKKIVSLTNSVVDGFLSGSGLPGKVLVTGKNTLAKYLQEEKKGYRADYGNVINEALSISPPISSKTKKAYSAFKTYRFGSTKKGKKELEQYNDFSPLHPYNVARAKIFSATTNIPVDRVLKKIENLNEAMFNESIEPQIKIALALGWDKWSLGFYDDLYGEDANVKEETKSKNKNTSSRKKAARQRAVKLENMPFKYRDSVRLANYKKRYKK